MEYQVLAVNLNKTAFNYAKWFAQVLGADGPDLCRSRVTSDDRCTGGGILVRSASSK